MSNPLSGVKSIVPQRLECVLSQSLVEDLNLEELLELHHKKLAVDWHVVRNEHAQWEAVRRALVAANERSASLDLMRRPSRLA